MKSKSFKQPSLLLFVIFTLAVIASGCTITINTGSGTPQVMPTTIDASTGSVQATTEPVVVMPTVNPNMPGEPPATREGEIEDTSSTSHASEKRAIAGDTYKGNFYERPFTASDMDYLPDVDIQVGSMTSDSNFFYFFIELAGVNTQTGNLMASYGVELDTDVDGRGEYSIWALNPSGTEWTNTNVTVFKDNNGSVGGNDPYLQDINNGDGYETPIPNDGEFSAWVRVDPAAADIVQIAIHRNLVGNPVEMLWGVLADNGLKDPGLFDYSDHFSRDDAGSPYTGYYYPLKQVPALDNTCRRPWGFIPYTHYANACWSYAQPAPTSKPGVTPQPGCTSCQQSAECCAQLCGSNYGWTSGGFCVEIPR